MEAYSSSGSSKALGQASSYVNAECNTADEANDSTDDIVYDSMNLNETDRTVPKWLATLIDSEYLYKINGSLCLFIPAANGWMPLKSSVALRIIADMTGGTNASVNYSIAAEPALALIKRHMWPTADVDSTFTQGRCRYYFKHCESSNHIMFYPVDNKKANKSIPYRSYCVIPTSIPRAVLKLPADIQYYIAHENTALKWVIDLFGINTLTALWSIGDSLCDFGNKRMFVVYGPGGIGKSAIAKIFKELVGQTYDGQNNLIIESPKTFSKQDISPQVLLGCASARMVFFSDFEVKPGEDFNMRTIKSLTGGDMAQDVAVSVTVMGTTNRLPTNNVAALHLTADRIRRTVIIPTVSKRNMADVSTLPIDVVSLNQLAYVSMVTRIKYDKPPLTVSALLYTLFLGRITEALQIVCEDRDASRMECVSGTVLLRWYFGIDMTDMDGSLCRVGSDCTINAWGGHYIARIKPRVGVNLMSVGPTTDESIRRQDSRWSALKVRRPAMWSV
jgi:hypothetical protein